MFLLLGQLKINVLNPSLQMLDERRGKKFLIFNSWEEHFNLSRNILTFLEINSKVFPFDEFLLSLWEWHAWVESFREAEETKSWRKLSSTHQRSSVRKRQKCNLCNRNSPLSPLFEESHQFAAYCREERWVKYNYRNCFNAFSFSTNVGGVRTCSQKHFIMCCYLVLP